VFFLFGEEEHLKDEAAQRIVDAYLDPATRDFNYDHLRGTDVDPETLASIANTPPMMAEWRVVVVRDAQGLAANARSRAVLEELIAKPMPGLALILIATLPDKAKAQIYEKLKKEATAVAFPQLSISDVPGWLVARAREEDHELDLDAARAMAGAIGSELGILVQELKKLYDYTRGRKSITLEDVKSCVGGMPRQNRWEWFDMVGDKRLGEAREALPILFDSGESGVGLIIGIGTHFLRLAILASGGERALEQALPPHQKWLAGRMGKQARKWQAQELDAALDDLLRADRLLKSSNLGDGPVLEELLLRMQARAKTN
jgi:DNA polymerase-3 subunit delta